MSDARIILLATTTSNDPLNAKPQNTFFKVGYNNTTNFGLDLIPLDLNMKGIEDFFQFDKVYYIDIPKDGDILTNLFLEFTINNIDWFNLDTAKPGSVFNTALGLLDYIEILCNDRVITKLDSSYIFAWNDYNLNSCQKKYFDQMTSYQLNKDNPIIDVNTGQQAIRLYLPIPFWFCRNPDLGIPLWACQSDRFGIRFRIKEDFWSGIGVNNPMILNIRPLIQVAQLDEEERKKFNENGLEYVIEQVEEDYKDVNENGGLSRVQLQTYPFVKEIVWLIQNTDLESSNKDLFDFRNHNNTDMEYNIRYANILLNGNAVAPVMDSKFFNLIQRWETHSADESFINSDIYSPFLNNRFYANEIYNYSFALIPEKVEPAGFCSTDKFNNITLEINANQSLTNGKRVLRIYQVRLNMYRVKNGHFSILHS